MIFEQTLWPFQEHGVPGPWVPDALHYWQSSTQDCRLFYWSQLLFHQLSIPSSEYPWVNKKIPELFDLRVQKSLDPLESAGCFHAEIILPIINQNLDIPVEQAMNKFSVLHHEILIEMFVDIASLSSILNLSIQFELSDHVGVFEEWL